ncbi:hypothetical protein C5167_040479 [Papaver somniferum]|uniref:DUF3444 domain-containing protein n=1 Tax=Papaver somniferum TaxID=3469 RepID=A0A4Y7IHI6_PAPSO|nr:hypothetical protein C5167_040479 [Papaver somniferum]
MQPPPGFAHRQGNALGKEAAYVNLEDEKTDSCNKNQNAEEIAAAADDDDLSEEGPESRNIEVPDPDFYDFDRDRTEECLAADQIWAICDDLDAMPRLYALIRKIYSPFEARIIWLDFVPDNQDEKAWDTSGLPVACGKFEHGDNGILDGIGKFSHMIVCEKNGRNTYKIYPRKGEIWALYKNWNIKWSSDPNNHREYEYEFVEVLSDYDKDMGVMVAKLVKIKGFVCMYKPVTTKNGMAIVQIPSDELLRFSHMVPSIRTTGKEREDVPEGYFVLDPAALPNSILEEVPDVIVSERVPTSLSSTTNPSQFPESELYVFDVDKSHDKFQTGQVWALYDKVDSLPKCYARINKVESYPRFKVHIQWLDNEMPTCCGLFSSGETAEFDETARFSHLAEGAVARTRNKYEIYPRDGEVWAIYREFNSGLSSSGLQKCQYDVAKVVKMKDTSIKVLVLEKVSGYLTVFKDRKNAGSECILEIPRRDLLRFSHQMPAFLLTDEKEGTLRGCWKLDPNAMPVSLFYLDSCKETAFSDQDATKEMAPNGMRTNPDIVAEKSPHEIRKRSQLRKSKKRKNYEQKNTMDGGRNMAGGNSSTKFADVYHKKRAEGASNCKSKDTTVLNSVKSCDGSAFGSKDAAAHAKKRSPGGVDVTPTSVNEQILSSSTYVKMSEIPATVFCNFDDERSSEKFKTGQVWSLYCKLDDLPKIYARIESVEFFPVFKLTIKWLESRHPPRGVVPWVDKGMPVCCGTFNVANGEGVVFKDAISFCHQLCVVPFDNNVYTIYPRAGEVWALHGKICSDMICSNLKICEYHLVEILDLTIDRWIIVSVLRSVTGFKTVFKVKEREALDSITAIPWIELYRFSHQVSSFYLEGARYGELRGCWELDPRTMPVHLHFSN